MFHQNISQGPYDIAIDCVCMFGSKEAKPRTYNQRAWEKGTPCSSCKKETVCGSMDFPALCGQETSLRESRNRWQTNFWKNRSPN